MARTSDEARAHEELIEAEIWEQRIVRLFDKYRRLHPNHPNRAAIAATEDLDFEDIGYSDTKGNLDLHRLKAQMYCLFAILERLRLLNEQETRASQERQRLAEQNLRVIALLAEIRDNTRR